MVYRDPSSTSYEASKIDNCYESDRLAWWGMTASDSRTQPRQLRLICFPYAGGGSSIYYRWQRLFPAGLQVVPALLPGREGRSRESAWDNLHHALAGLRHLLDLPVSPATVYFGHSMGALIAYAAAVRQRAQGVTRPIGLIVSSCCAPQLLSRKETYHQLDDQQLLESVLKGYDLCKSNAAGEAELMRLMLPTIRADFKLFETYRHEVVPPLPIPIQVLGGADDRYAARHELESWREQTSADFRCRIFPGGHFYFRSQEQQVVDVIAATCRRFVSADATT
jgi:surfactin synthase thioesterase subunit